MWLSLDVLLTGLHHLTGWKSLPWRAKPPPKILEKKHRVARKFCSQKARAHTVVLSRTVLPNLTFMWLAHRGFSQET